MAWIEGFTSSNDVLKTIARNACTSIKDAAGNIIKEKNWELIYPSPQKYRSVRRVLQEVLESHNYQLYKTSKYPIVENRLVRIFRNGQLVNASEYTINYKNGSILFNEVQREKISVTGETLTTTDRRIYQLEHGDVIASSLKVYRNGTEVDTAEYIFDAVSGSITFRFYQDQNDVITADYVYSGNPYTITVDYTCYSDVRRVIGEQLTTSDGAVFSTQNGNLSSDAEVKVYRNGSYVSPTEYVIDYQNGTIIFSSVQNNVVAVAGEVATSNNYTTYTVAHKPITFEDEVKVYRDGNLVQPNEYTIDRINGTITFNNVQRRVVNVAQEIASTSDNKIYSIIGSPIIPGSVVVYRDSQVVAASEYTLDTANNKIVFSNTQSASAVITVDYSYYGAPYAITVDYSYYDSIVSLQDVKLSTTNYITYATGQKNVLSQNLVVKRDGQTVNSSEYTLDAANGLIIFKTMQDSAAVITASFMFCPRIDYISADYSYYASVEDVINEELLPVNNQIFYTANKPISSEHMLTVYINGTSVGTGEYEVDYLTGAVIFDDPLDNTDQVTIDYSYYTNGIEEAIAAVKDRIVLKTTTTPVELTDEQKLQNLYSDERLNVTSISMYVEFQKPDRLVNPETGNEYYKDSTGLYVQTSANHHYINVRMFDKWEPVLEQPVPSIYDSTGKLVTAGAAISPWSKWSWFRDWEEVPYVYATSTITDDKQISKGPILRPIALPSGLSEIPIRYWMSVNNDRIIAVLMGEPSVDYSNYLIGFAYIGRIKPYEGGINDTFGNFALTTSSSTIPCKMIKPPSGKPTIESLTVSGSGGTLPYGYSHCYVVTYITTDGESPPSDIKYTFTSVSGVSNNTYSITIKVQLPENAIGWKIYRYRSGERYPDKNDTRYAVLSNYQLIATINDASLTTYTDNGSVNPVNETPAPQGRSTSGVERDPKTGVVIKVNYPDAYGAGTATGVTDISMYRTRGGAYYQQHRAAFHTQEEFMTKVGFNPSSYTGKVYVSCVSVVHPFDGYRGMLEDVVAVDATSLAPLDELVINKGQTNEEVYKFFAVNAPYSFLTTSANSAYGIAIKKG